MSLRIAKLGLALQSLAIVAGVFAPVTAATAQAPVPPPVEQFTANCGASSYATDQLVCADRELRREDADMGRRLDRIDSAILRGRPPLLESQSEWFRRRSRCAFERGGRRCAQAAYAERAQVIRSANVVPDRATVTLSCRAPFMRNGRGWLTREGAFVVRDGPRLAAVALPQGRPIWRPYATWSRNGRATVVQGLRGARLTCSPQREFGRDAPR